VLKIDRSFIHNLPESREAAAVVAAIITMASALGLEVVAEGIENECQYGFLQSLNCPMGQGYLFSKPTPAGDFVPDRVFALEAASLVGANP
jgi:EAL domain-containing protein (putative c-di-GMP-specific phosphodiesterase class I)